MRDGGEDEGLAPVIPLFGGAAPQRAAPRPDQRRRVAGSGGQTPDGGTSDGGTLDEALDDEIAEDEIVGDAWTSEIVEASSREFVEDVVTDEGWRGGTPGSGTAWHPTWTAPRPSLSDGEAASAEGVELAEKALLKKLRTRALSVAEARGILREHDLDSAETDHVIASIEEYGYLDDAALAEQLIHLGVDRKGQGRQVIAQTLSKRGIPRDVADAALAALPDDEAQQALDFARSRAARLRDLDDTTALRRLLGQLMRRGYGGSAATNAARTALAERSGGSSGVRFR